MPKHGFAKKMEFEVEVQTADELVFLLRDTEETRVGFPYAFELRVRYAFVNHGFVMEFSVKNVNDETMYFSLGAHPAFAIDLGDKVMLDEAETLAAFKLDENFLRGKVQQPVFDNARELVITAETFAKDALIFDGIKSKGASVIRANGKNVHVAFDAPCLGIWAKPAAPYVCIEPWHGIDDMCDAGHDIAKKERIEVLGAGETWVFTFMPAPLSYSRQSFCNQGPHPVSLHHSLFALSVSLFPCSLPLPYVYLPPPPTTALFVFPNSSFPAAFTLSLTFLQPGPDPVSLCSNAERLTLRGS